MSAHPLYHTGAREPGQTVVGSAFDPVEQELLVT